MLPNDSQIPDAESTDDDQSGADPTVSRRAAVKAFAAAGASATVLAGAGNALAGSTPHTIVVRRRSEYVEYRIEVSEEIVRVDDADFDEEAIHDGTVAVGVLSEENADSVDDFEFAGEIVDLHVETGSAEFEITRRDETRVEEREGDEDEEHEVSIRAHGPHVDYEFVVSGDVEPGDAADIGTGDYIDGDVVTGNVAGSGSDNYQYTGDIEKFHVTDADEVTVEIDGEEIDPDDVGDWGHLMIEAHGPHVKYEFETDGEFEPGSEAEMGVGSFIDDGVASGNVAGSHGRDNYWFSGDLTSGWTASDDVTVRVDGEAVDPDDIGD